MPTSVERCHVCGNPALEEEAGYPALVRVTSDCQPWPAGGRVAVCHACGTVQNVLDQAWHEDMQQIYAAYAVYHQSGGTEQAVFEQGSGRASPRSASVLGWLGAAGVLASSGRLLDIGCANGPLLREFGRRAPGWTLAGTEFNDKYRAAVERLPGVTAFYTCPVDEISGTFTLITLMHVLEHIPDPVRFLTQVRGRLDDSGHLVVEVPDARQNPFDLLIADHCSHFTAGTLTDCVRRAGYEVVARATDCVPKEISLLARKAGASRNASTTTGLDRAPLDLGRRVAWLQGVAAAGRGLARAGNLGLFGTSIAATWLANELGDGVRFFVDEDPARVGNRHLGRAIYHPDGAPPGSDVFLALPPELAGAVHTRLARSGVLFRCHQPPRLEAA
jgi:hypothetical protein